jgi:hypothetical protein
LVERSIAPPWKGGGFLGAPRVRIPYLPPIKKANVINKILLYIASAFSGSGLKPGPANELKVVVPSQYVYPVSGRGEHWLKEEVTDWLDAHSHTVVNQGYDGTQYEYMILFKDSEIALMFKLTFPE